jgi:hypothetical protein
MDVIGIWLSPLLLLPGAGLLIMSASQRFNRLHDEIHHLIELDSNKSQKTVKHLMKRAHYFRNALVLLYSSIAIFAIAGLLGGITSGLGEISFYITVGLTILGILFLAAASIILIKESALSLEIMKIHLGEINS